MTYRADLTAVCIKMAMRAGGFKVDNKGKNPNFQWKRPIKIA
jgi:hypothetical protein|tara:strand:- start:81 stop:206 length:126 start_codon:yes stop_codon:yes gene_type:complete